MYNNEIFVIANNGTSVYRVDDPQQSITDIFENTSANTNITSR